MMKPKLIVVGGEVKSKEVALDLPMVIGRGRDVTLTLPHALVSRRHCEIYEYQGQLMVRDLGSLNGTFVNNKRIEDDNVLAPGELLTIGSVTFRAAYESVGETLSAGKSDTTSIPQVTGDTEAYQDRHQLIDRDTNAAGDLQPEQPELVSEKPMSNPIPFSSNTDVEIDINETIAFIEDSKS